MFRSLFIAALLALMSVSSAHAQVQDWLLLRQPGRTADFYTLNRFITAHPDWPDVTTIKIKAEDALQAEDTATILRYFGRFEPVTDAGRILYIQNLRLSGRTPEAMVLFRKYWREGRFSTPQQDRLLPQWRSAVTMADHVARLDELLWTSQLDRAEKALSYVDATTRQSGLARLRLQRFDRRALDTVTAIPRSQRTDGLWFDLARYYRNKKQDALAAEALSQRKNAVADAHAAQWWRERAILARRALENGHYTQAYRLAAAHGTTTAVELSDAEWLAGWLAVTRLKQPDAALKHFDRMYHNVKTPISVSRAAYWAGVAAGQMGAKDTAAQWYRLAARHMHTFYGQLAAYALGDENASFDAFFARNQSVPAATGLRADMVTAATTLHKMGREKERDLFLRALLRVHNDAPQKIIPLARALNSPSTALMAAKAAYEKNILITDALFPKLTPPKMGSLPTALTLGIIRQESQFDRFAVSPAGARGLMQLMPATAVETARKLGIAHSGVDQLYQPDHNMRLGQAYLSRMLARYNNTLPLAIASYNAGPGNVDNWVAEMGDPQADPYSWVDWVERIPFYETRNYVQRVYESYKLYDALLRR